MERFIKRMALIIYIILSFSPSVSRHYDTFSLIVILNGGKNDD